jgi:hypothetical protein
MPVPGFGSISALIHLLAKGPDVARAKRRMGVLGAALISLLAGWSLILAEPRVSARGQADVEGQGSALSYTMPINPIHVALLRNGQILGVSGLGNWPSTQAGHPTGAHGPSNYSGPLVLDPSTGKPESGIGFLGHGLQLRDSVGGRANIN